MSFISSLCSFASLVHLLHSLSLPYKSQVESETQLQKKCFPGMSPAAEWVFSNGIPNFELFFSWKGTRLGVHSGGQGVDQQGDRQGDKPCKDPGGQWWEDQEGRLGDDDPLLHTRPVGALDETWPKVRFNVWASGVRAVEPEKLIVLIMLKKDFGTWLASLAGNFGSHTRLYMQVSAIMVNLNFEI